MLLICTLGMLSGLAIDLWTGRVAMLATLCLQGRRGLPYWEMMHWTGLPACILECCSARP